MSAFDDPFDSEIRLKKNCSCGAHSSESEHDLLEREVALSNRVLESAIVRALFPQDESAGAF